MRAIASDCSRRRRRKAWRPIARGALAAIAIWTSIALAGCGRQSTLSPHSPQTHQIALLWWWMLGVATIVFLGAVAMLGIAWWRRTTPGLPFFGEREDISQGLVILFGIGIPLVVLTALFGVANVYVIGHTAAPNPKTTSMTIDVIGHQWWWEVRYPGTQAVTANEIHIPTNTRVNLVAESADVIHSFWIPQLAGKMDAIPNRNNYLWMDPREPGVYFGNCAEYCGTQHANMMLRVIAHPSGDFDKWAAQQQKAPEQDARAATGKASFESLSCVNCHNAGGYSSETKFGPDLTHLMSRQTIGSGVLTNTHENLRRWVNDPQEAKPGCFMPSMKLTGQELDQVVAYLETLK